MKVFFGRPHAEQVPDDPFEALTWRYRAAYDEYQGVVEKINELTLNGDKPSELAHLEEERAFEELDVARHALMAAAEQAYPTIH
jgi:hypothetical protein